ncbi:MAG TPA: substrate-binding domain-containing protein [Armatimonadota bacterium]|nr:substrate-binding domain-containing protein [Armatimonadota bacterium]
MRPLLSFRAPLLALTACAALAGCTSPSATNSAAPSGGGPGASGTLTIGVMPKQKGIPYFNACEKGAQEAAKELGDVNLVYDGPIEDQSEKQSSMLDTWVTRRFNAVAVACNDPEQISASLARARDQGIAVVTYDADANPETSKRQFFVNQADAAAIAKALVDEMAAQVGEDAKVAVVSSSSTAPNQVAWLKEMDTYAKASHPKLTVVTIEYAGEDQQKARQKAESILKAYPDVKGIYGMTSVAFPGAAQAVDGAGQAGKVAVVGLGTPNVMKDFVKRGVVKTVILWNPVDLGYLTLYVARATAKGELKEGDTTFKAGRLGEKQVKGSVVLLGEPMKFTKDNIDQYDF